MKHLYIQWHKKDINILIKEEESGFMFSIITPLIEDIENPKII